MLNRYTLPLISALVVSASLASCQRKEIASVPELPPVGEIGFTVSDSDAETKSTPLETNYFRGEVHNPFNVVVYKHAAGAATSAWELFSDKTTCEYNSAYGLWIPSESINWPMTKEKLTFIAYAPSSLQPSPTTSSGEALTSGEAPCIKDFTVNSDVNAQEDILLASKESSASPLVGDLNVGLEFRHALTFVKFSIGVGTTCSSITLSGILGTGTLDMSTGAWSSVRDTVSYTISDPAFGSWNANWQCPIADGQTLMLIPQTLPADAKLKAVTSAGTITASLAGQEWEPGKVVTYKLTDPVASFSVSPTQKVRFSPGNLQYLASTGTWRFVAHQWDYVGDASNGNVYVGETKCDNSKIGASYDGWIDLFGWGTSGHEFSSRYGSAYQPWSTSTTNTNYGPTDGTSGLTGDYALGDWGVKNMGSGWRTLTKAEWVYLLNTRDNDNNESTLYPRYCKATVNGVSGMVIFPDSYSYPSGVAEPASVNYPKAYFSTNTWDGAGWSAMESAGCVFLPAAGARGGSSASYVGSFGHYWSSMPNGTNGAYLLYFSNINVDPAAYYHRAYGLSVRLVQDLP